MVATFLARKYFPTERIKKEHSKQGARDLLASLASDVDLFLDWWFMYDTHYVKTDEERKEIGSTLIIIQFAFTLAGTFSWFALVSDGRMMNFILNMIWTLFRPLFCFNGCLNFILICCCNIIIRPCFPTYAFTIKERIKKGRYDINRLKEIQISSGYLEFQGIILEDIPQVIITFLIDSAAETGGSLGGGYRYSPTGLAVTNFLSSMYNALIKLADAYDKRNHVMTFTSVKNVLREHTLDVNCIAFVDDYYDVNGIKINKKNDGDNGGNDDYYTTMFLTGSDDNTIKLWGLSQCSKKYKVISEFKEHTSSVTCIAYMGNNYFVSGSVDGTIKLWNLSSAGATTSTSRSIRTFEHHSNTAKEGLFSIFAKSSTKCCVYTVAKVDNEHFVSGSGDGTIKLWNISSASSNKCIVTLTDHGRSVNALALLGNTEYFLSASSDKTIKLWNVKSRTCVNTFEGHSRPVNSLAVLTDNTFVSGSDDGTMRLWDITKQEQQQNKDNGDDNTDDDTSCCIMEYKRRYYTRCVRTLCRINDTTFIAASDYRISVWSIDNCKSPIRTYTGNIGAIINTIGYVPDRTDIFITGSDDKSVRIWSMKKTQSKLLSLQQQMENDSSSSDLSTEDDDDADGEDDYDEENNTIKKESGTRVVSDDDKIVDEKKGTGRSVKTTTTSSQQKQRKSKTTDELSSSKIENNRRASTSSSRKSIKSNNDKKTRSTNKKRNDDNV